MFADLDQTTVSASLRLNWIFSPRLSLEVYAQPLRNAVLRWEYSPGSTLFLVWTQNRSDSESVGSFRTGHALDRLFGATADNIFMVKVSYWWSP